VRDEIGQSSRQSPISRQGREEREYLLAPYGGVLKGVATATIHAARLLCSPSPLGPHPHQTQRGDAADEERCSADHSCRVRVHGTPS